MYCVYYIKFINVFNVFINVFINIFALLFILRNANKKVNFHENRVTYICFFYLYDSIENKNDHSLILCNIDDVKICVAIGNKDHIIIFNNNL